jgi:hypothetical protein
VAYFFFAFFGAAFFAAAFFAFFAILALHQRLMRGAMHCKDFLQRD